MRYICGTIKHISSLCPGLLAEGINTTGISRQECLCYPIEVTHGGPLDRYGMGMIGSLGEEGDWRLSSVPWPVVSSITPM